jgi:hypothetical protein
VRQVGGRYECARIILGVHDDKDKLNELSEILYVISNATCR